MDTNRELRIAFDINWKELTTEFVEEFIQFFFGESLYSEIDFGVEPEYLEQELSNGVSGNQKHRKKVTDKLIRFTLKNGQSKFVLVHVEFQGPAGKAFMGRMFEYYTHIMFRYSTTNITAIVIYTGDSKPKVFDRFEANHYGTSLCYKFNTYTVIEQTEDKLLESDNPFAMAVLANLYVLQTRDDLRQRLEYKKKLFEIAKKRNFGESKAHRLLLFIQYLITLPDDLNLEFEKSIQSNNPSNTMTIRPQAKTLAEAMYIGAFGFSPKTALEEKNKAEQEKAKAEEKIARMVINLHFKMGLSVEEIAKENDLELQFVQAIIDSYRGEK